MHAKSGQRAKSASDDVFDVRILAFAGARAQHVRGLQEILGVDAATAQRIVDTVPSVVRRAASKHEAHDCSRALQNIGAQVVVEQTQGAALAGEAARRPAPPPARGAAPPPPPPPSAAGVGRPSLDNEATRRLLDLSEPPLPRPILRAATADLEFDMLAMDEVEDEAIGLGAGEPEFALDQLDDSVLADLGTDDRTRQTIRKSSRDEIDLESSGGGGELDLLQVTAPRGAPSASFPSADESPTRHASIPQTKRTQTSRTQRAGNVVAREPSGAQRMPVVARAAPAEQPRVETPARATRSRALLQLLAAIAVIGMGLHFDNSVFYGNASLFSVVAHGLAFQQLCFGVLGLFR